MGLFSSSKSRSSTSNYVETNTQDNRVAASDSGIALQSGAVLNIDNESPEAWELGGKIVDIAGQGFAGSIDFAREAGAGAFDFARQANAGALEFARETRAGEREIFDNSLASIERARIEDSTELTSLALKLAAVAIIGVVAFRSLGK